MNYRMGDNFDVRFDDPNYHKFVQAFCSASKLFLGDKEQLREDTIWFQDAYNNNFYVDSHIVYRVGMKLYRLENKNEKV